MYRKLQLGLLFLPENFSLIIYFDAALHKKKNNFNLF